MSEFFRELCEWLRSEGYTPASCLGIPLQDSNGEEVGGIGVLLSNNSRPTLIKKLFKRPKLEFKNFLGIIWVENEIRGAHKGHWIIDVRHRRYLHKARKLAAGIGIIFCVKVTLRYVFKKAKLEERVVF